MVKFIDASGKITMIDRVEFMRYMRALWEVSQLNKRTREESKKVEKEENKNWFITLLILNL